jgi:hypothetical protein
MKKGCLTLSALLLVLVVIPFASHYLLNANASTAIVETEDFADLQSVLGEAWRNSDVLTLNHDMRGISYSMVSHNVMTTVIEGVKFPSVINQHIISYKDKSEAQKRYMVQKEWIFDFDSGVPPSRQKFSYKQLEILHKNEAQDAYFACKDSLVEMKCGFIALYDENVVFVDFYVKRNKVLYLEEGQLKALVKIVSDHYDLYFRL